MTSENAKQLAKEILNLAVIDGRFDAWMIAHHQLQGAARLAAVMRLGFDVVSVYREGEDYALGKALVAPMKHPSGLSRGFDKQEAA